MRKRILAALLAALLLVGMIGCSAQPTEAEKPAPVTEEPSGSAEIGAGGEAVDGVETDAEADTAGTAEAQRIAELQQPRKTQM